MFDRVSQALRWAHTAAFRFQSWTQAAIPRLQHGQGLAEYALILALIAIVAIVALIFLGSKVSTILSTVGKSI